MPRVMRAPAVIVIVVIMPSRSANFSVATRIECGHARQQNNVKSQNNFFHFNLPQIRPTHVSVVFCSLFRVYIKQGRCQLMDSKNSGLKADKHFLTYPFYQNDILIFHFDSARQFMKKKSALS
jgi:hypothetical protein